MAHKTLIGGTAYGVSGGKCLVGGTGYSIKKGRTLVSGTGYDISLIPTTPISDLTVGSIVYVNENGTPAPFYIAKHDYESTLNGTGRTLLVRKECYTTGQWHTYAASSSGSPGNKYESSYMDSWFNSTYKALLDAEMQEAIGTTSFYYSVFNQSAFDNYYSSYFGLGVLQRSVFALSIYEITGYGYTWCNPEGEYLAITVNEEVGGYQWSRTPVYNDIVSAGCVGIEQGSTYGSYKRVVSNQSVTADYGFRPCFTLPSDVGIDENNNIVV